MNFTLLSASSSSHLCLKREMFTMFLSLIIFILTYLLGSLHVSSSQRRDNQSPFETGGINPSSDCNYTQDQSWLSQTRHTLGYPLVCTHQKIDRFVGLLVPATSSRNHTSLIRGGQSQGPKMWSLRLEFRCKIRVQIWGLIPRASLCDKSLRPVPLFPSVCLALNAGDVEIRAKLHGKTYGKCNLCCFTHLATSLSISS